MTTNQAASERSGELYGIPIVVNKYMANTKLAVVFMGQLQVPQRLFDDMRERGPEVALEDVAILDFRAERMPQFHNPKWLTEHYVPLSERPGGWREIFRS